MVIIILIRVFLLPCKDSPVPTDRIYLEKRSTDIHWQEMENTYRLSVFRKVSVENSIFVACKSLGSEAF
jgi:hypothetical protein